MRNAAQFAWTGIIYCTVQCVAGHASSFSTNYIFDQTSRCCIVFQGCEILLLLLLLLLLSLFFLRSLEKCLDRTRITLSPEAGLDERPASHSEQDSVQAVLEEAEHPDYWVSASKDGNREAHYRGKHCFLLTSSAFNAQMYRSHPTQASDHCLSALTTSVKCMCAMSQIVQAYDLCNVTDCADL